MKDAGLGFPKDLSITKKDAEDSLVASTCVRQNSLELQTFNWQKQNGTDKIECF